jgi:short-subunit dehydrogenase
MTLQEQDFTRRYGPWALVAGGAQGIGAAYARAAARRGLHVIVLDVNRQQLQAFCTELAQAHRVEVLPVEIDLAAPDLLERLDGALGAREVGLLVYNAGVADVGPFFKGGHRAGSRVATDRDQRDRTA